MQSAWREKKIWRGYAGVVLLVLALASCGHAAGSEIRATTCSIPSPGETGECTLILDRVSPGLSEFEVQVTLENPAIGKITGIRFPSWANLNSKSKVPADSVVLKGADAGRKVGPGQSEVVLATLTIRGDATGTCGIQVVVLGMKDEAGSPYLIAGKDGTLTVREPPEDIPERESSAGSSSLLPHDMGVQIILMPTLTPAPPGPEVTAVPEESLPIPPDTFRENNIGSDDQDPENPGTEEKTGVLCTDSEPGGAKVTVDGRIIGKTPLCIVLDEGAHHLFVSAEGYSPWEGEVFVSSTEQPNRAYIILEEERVYTITAGTGTHGSVHPSGSVRVGHGESAVFTFSPDPGYRLGGIQIDGVWYDAKSPVLFEDVTTNHSLWGTFTPIPPPVAGFSANRTEGYAPLGVLFRDQTTGEVSGMLWEFGDNTSSFETSPVHTYVRTGSYTVSLEVCGAGGCNLSRKEHYIIVREKEPLIADFTANATFGPAPLCVQFQDNSTGNPASWYWDFGDGTNSTGPSPCHLFAAPGIYTVRLIIVADDGVTEAAKEGVVNVSPQVIGGSVGFFEVRCPAEGAHVFLDGRYKGPVENGSLTIPVYVTATPSRIIQVKAEGYLQYYGYLQDYPMEGETIVLEIPLQPALSNGSVAARFQVPPLMGNLSLSGSSPLV
ncbi:MAG TPA: PKD domain-containing protein [Methanolinea sp.]|nr:PKD domain-containing protein [Methanolinea sp.]HQK56458.1 PKD domain-containing protein [Methanolinea sp.]